MPEHRFLVDSTLGRLARWLRLLGFDTEYDPQPPDAQRLTQLRLAGQRTVLTRSRAVIQKLPLQHVLFVAADDPQVQISALIRDLHLRREEMNPFSRCGICNRPLQRLLKNEIAGRVPDYIFETHAHFLSCPRCGRIYWPGSHQQRWTAMIARWFEP